MRQEIQSYKALQPRIPKNSDSSDASFQRAFIYISGLYGMKALSTQEQPRSSCQ